MGGGASKASSCKESIGVSSPGHDHNDETKWRRTLTAKEAMAKYVHEGTLSPDSSKDLLELRELLDSNMLSHNIGMFRKDQMSMSAYICWQEVQDYRHLASNIGIDFKITKARAIFNKFLKTGSPLRIADIDKEYENEISSFIENKEIDVVIFNKLSQVCLSKIYDEVFVNFKKTAGYRNILKDMHNGYNKVVPDDFRFFNVLGSGTFGIVIRVQKKSTGRFYALKVQSKQGLLGVFKHAPHRVDFEKQALASCKHPFIVSLDYAFQTESIVFLATSLGRAGTLEKLSRKNKSIPEKHVVFYAIEMLLALAHIHRMGMIYRDLKPENVLLCEDGHCQLVDLGGIVDPSGKTLEEADDTETKGIFVRKYGHHKNSEDGSISVNTEEQNSIPVTLLEEVANGDSQAQLGRARSIMGSNGYMAIEMVYLKMARTKHMDIGNRKKGYSNAVDWWSFGATLYSLLLRGATVFPNMNAVAILASADDIPFFDEGISSIISTPEVFEEKGISQMSKDHQDAYKSLVSVNASFWAISLILQCLDFNEHTRLGSPSSGGCNKLIMHPFFYPKEHLASFEKNEEATIQTVHGPAQCASKQHYMDMCEHKQLAPPFIPKIEQELQDQCSDVKDEVSFEETLNHAKKSSWLRSAPSVYYQEYFASWDYISPETLKREYGIANEDEQYESNFKARALLGPRGSEGGNSEQLGSPGGRNMSGGMNT